MAGCGGYFWSRSFGGKLLRAKDPLSIFDPIPILALFNQSTQGRCLNGRTTCTATTAIIEAGIEGWKSSVAFLLFLERPLSLFLLLCSGRIIIFLESRLPFCLKLGSLGFATKAQGLSSFALAAGHDE